jgi:hypothetical protein
MRLRRRLACFAALFAVTWASLWPLVSTAHAWMADETMPLCHRAGMQVAPDDRAGTPDGPIRDGKVHCPLCIMAFYAAHAEPLQAPRVELSRISVALPAEREPLLSRFESPLPPSRAPPSFRPA